MTFGWARPFTISLLSVLQHESHPPGTPGAPSLDTVATGRMITLLGAGPGDPSSRPRPDAPCLDSLWTFRPSATGSGAWGGFPGQASPLSFVPIIVLRSEPTASPPPGDAAPKVANLRFLQLPNVRQHPCRAGRG